MTKFRTRQTGKTPLRPPDQPPDWMREEAGSVRAGLLAQLCLGALPRRVASYACAVFDVDDAREYRGDDGVKAAGRSLAGLAAQIVRHAKDPTGYLQALKQVPANIIQPLKTYLRVRLALGRLEAEIAGATTPLSSRNCEAISGTSPDQDDVDVNKADNCDVPIDISSKRINLSTPPPLTRSRIFSGENSGMTEGVGPHKPTFTYHTSPAKTYAFKEITAELGYDPRGTSVYWIERRANRLRRRWKAYHKEQSGEQKLPVSKPVTAKVKPPEGPPKIRHFEPPEADYNSVWPPVELPKGPPKLAAPVPVLPKPSHLPSTPPPLSSRPSKARAGLRNRLATPNIQSGGLNVDEEGHGNGSPVQANVEESRADKYDLPHRIASKRSRLSTPETLTRSRIFSRENSGLSGVGGANGLPSEDEKGPQGRGPPRKLQ